MNVDQYKTALLNLPEEIKQAEADIEFRSSFLIGVSGGVVEETSVSEITEIYVRATGEKTGYAYTQDLSEDPQAVFQRAFQNGQFVDKNEVDCFNTSETSFSGHKGHESPLVNLDEMILKASQLEAYIQDGGGFANTLAEIRIEDTVSHVLNSEGVDAKSIGRVYYASVDVMALKDGVSYNASCSVTAKSYEELDVIGLKKTITEDLEHQFNPKSVVSGEYPVVLDRSVGINIMTTAWQIFSGLKYANGSSCLAEKYGKLIGSDALTIIDAPFHKNTGYEYSFDCEGTTAKETKLVENGKLTGLMNNIKSAGQLNKETSGNAGRYALLSGTIPTDIIITPHICYIEQGEQGVGELLEAMQDGIYITKSYDVFHSINIGSGDFSIPCQGVVIKDGKKQYAVSPMTISGNLLDLFENVTAVANDLTILEFLKKTYCVGAPSILVRKMQVSGE